MKKLLMLVSIVLVATAGFAGEHPNTPVATSPGFDKLKSLAGEWTADIPNMGKVTAVYSMHSDRSALLEQLTMPNKSSMITVYYPAGKDVVMTHYCSSHNQPHMKASGASAETVSFRTTSIENLSSKNAEHMDAVKFTFRDDNHFTAAWRNIAAGKSMTTPFEFTRVR